MVALRDNPRIATIGRGGGMGLLDLVVETKGLGKRYGGTVLAVDNLELRVRRGEVYGFLGPNGAGKTTTLKMLLGLVRPTAGSATVVGHPAGAGEGLKHIGAIVESPAFYPYLSGRDNLTVMADYSRVASSRIDAALDEVQLANRARDKFATYSLGMKQRLGIAAALLKEPDLLILDEPTNGLDPAGMVEIRALIKELGRGQRTVLLSSHLLGEVEQICDRVGVIQKGKLVTEGTVEELRGDVTLLVRAQPLSQAGETLERLLGRDAVSIEDGVFRLKVDSSRAAEITRTLVAAGVEVIEVRRSERSLEEAFLTITGDESGL
ncbi:MAG: ABC transporter ATP-binding protein [Candidatus Dormibacteraeota bacterium]|nr:ABC transporter ATP-binding protein [Candidatus Dormibacteraeota bacterium]